MNVLKVLIFLVVSVSPAWAADFTAIEKFGACSDPLELSKLTHLLATAIRDPAAGKEFDEKRAAAKQCSEDALSPAIQAAGKFADLKIAVKEFYVKGAAYIAKAGQANNAVEERERNEAWQRVRMEMKLSGN